MEDCNTLLMEPMWKNVGGGLLLERPPHASNDDITQGCAIKALNNRGGTSQGGQLILIVRK